MPHTSNLATFTSAQVGIIHPALTQVEAGEDVVISRRGEPVARLVGCKPRSKRQPDVLKGKVVIPENFFDPLSEEELTAWEGK